MVQDILIIDRIEENIAVCEGQSGMVNIPISLIESGAKESDVIFKKNGIYLIDRKLTEKRKFNIEEMMKGMWE